MDMKKINKMDGNQLDAELEKVKSDKPKLQQVIKVINKRINEAKEDVIVGDKPRYDVKKLEKDLNEAKESVFEIEKFEKMFDSLKSAAFSRMMQAKHLEDYNNFLRALRDVVQAQIDGKPWNDEDVGIIKTYRHNSNVKYFTNRIRLTR